jgi:Dyp-type peroxidase family
MVVAQSAPPSTLSNDYEPMLEPVLNVHEIQGNSIGGFSKDYEMLLFLQIQDVAQAKRWLYQIEPYIATAAEVLQFNRLFKATRSRRHGKEGTVRSTFMNIGFSYKGLSKLTPEADQFTDEAFKEGLAARSAALGDPTDPNSPGHPNNWLIGGTNNEPDIVLIIASDDRSHLDKEVKNLIRSLPVGLRLMSKQRGETLPGALAGHEHFGFKDGISQPGIRGRISDKPDDFLTKRESDDPNQGKPGQDLLHAGEFIFGYPTQIGEPARDESGNQLDGLNTNLGPIAVAGPTWAENGSYLVFRRLRQDVKGFHSFLKTAAAKLAATNPALANLTPDKLGAKMVGRWKSGAPILKAPDRDNPALAEDLDFEFEDEDSQGLVCPFAAHIRKTYPRDTERFGGAVNESATQTRRLLRRGIPFGKPLATQGGCPMRSFTSLAGLLNLYRSLIHSLANLTTSEMNDRGLVFLAYQTSITRQFEFVSNAWVNNPGFPGNPDGQPPEDSGHDPILGQNPDGVSRDRSFTIQMKDGQNVKLDLPKDWIIPTGGGYFFTPSISALKYLAGSAQ